MDWRPLRPIELAPVKLDRMAADELNKRQAEAIGRIVRSRGVMGIATHFDGTRIPSEKTAFAA